MRVVGDGRVMKEHQTVRVAGWFAVIEVWLMLRMGLFRNVLAFSAVFRTA